MIQSGTCICDDRFSLTCYR